MSKQVAIEQDGKVIETLPNAMFKVELENGLDTYHHSVDEMCAAAGTPVVGHARVLVHFPADTVTLEFANDRESE